VLRKINQVFVKHQCLFLHEGRLIKRLPSTNKQRCLKKHWFISLSASPKPLALYKALQRLGFSQRVAAPEFSQAFDAVLHCNILIGIHAYVQLSGRINRVVSVSLMNAL
jgi:hypothetical protein